MFFRRLLSYAAAVLLIAAAAGSALGASLDGLAVDVINKSKPVLCAEKDNVSLAFSSGKVRSFRIEAVHPAYLPLVRSDSFEPDWTACDMTSDPSVPSPAPPRRQTIYEEPDLWLVAWTFPSFWRPAGALVRVGDRTERNVHMLQLWVRRPNGGEEILVFYPPDGYWRARPMSPAGMAPTAFGSSFLIGPIEQDGRPFVRIKEIAFDPAARAFTLSFEKGGSATVATRADAARHILNVTFDRAVAGDPFAMLRSMYVTEVNNDVAHIAVRERAAEGWREQNIMAFDKAIATDIWTGRLTPSRHNASAPDMVFSSFSEAASATSRSDR